MDKDNKRREQVKTPWIEGAPAEDDIGKVLLVRTSIDRHPWVIRVKRVAKNGDITAQTVDDFREVSFAKSDIVKYYPLPPKTQEVINQCKKT